jgi:type VI secretion system secreted protein Hcp
MKIDSIPGGSTDSNFKNEIELKSFQWSAGVGCTQAQGADRTVTTASVSEVTASKLSDKSTEKLFKSLLKGESVGKATVSFVAAVKGESVAYLTIELEEVIISGWSMSSAGDAPMETISMHFTKFDWAYHARDAAQGTQKTHLTYSLIDNKVG